MYLWIMRKSQDSHRFRQCIAIARGFKRVDSRDTDAEMHTWDPLLDCRA